MDDLEPVFTVEQNYFYIGISKGTSPETFRQWQSALNEMKQGEHSEFFENFYGDSPEARDSPRVIPIFPAFFTMIA